MVRQLLLLENATVRGRATELLAAGTCTADPPDRSLSARKIITPMRTKLCYFDATLLASWAPTPCGPAAAAGPVARERKRPRPSRRAATLLNFVCLDLIIVTAKAERIGEAAKDTHFDVLARRIAGGMVLRI